MTTGTRAILSSVSLLLIAGSLVLMFFVILSGLKHSTPLDKTYFLRVDTSSIPGARAVSQWTYFYVCGDGNTDCGAAVPALPVGYAWGSETTNVPAALLGKHGKGSTSTYYYYMWRFGWVTYLIALVFDVLAFFLGFLAFVGRLGAGLSGLMAAIAAFWMAIAVSLMTAEFIKMRDVFNAAGMNASIGKYAFGFSWGAFACMAVATILFMMGVLPGNDAAATRSTKKSMFRRNRSTRSRGSFVDNESQRRVKEEYV